MVYYLVFSYMVFGDSFNWYILFWLINEIKIEVILYLVVYLLLRWNKALDLILIVVYISLTWSLEFVWIEGLLDNAFNYILLLLGFICRYCGFYWEYLGILLLLSLGWV